MFVFICIFLAACSSSSSTKQDNGNNSVNRPRSLDSYQSKTGSLLPSIGRGHSTSHREGFGVIWRFPLEHPATGLHVSPQQNFVATGPERITVLDQKGRHLWHRNLAPGDRVIPSGACLYVELASDNILTALGEKGEPRWERQIVGTLNPLGDGQMFVADAAAVSALDCRRGREHWMFSADRIRSLRLNSTTDTTISLIGELGQKRTLFVLSRDGKLQSTKTLPDSIVFAEEISAHSILARTTQELIMLDGEGHRQWSRPIGARTEVARHRDSIVLADSSPDGVITVRVYTTLGSENPRCTVQVGAEPVSVRIVIAPDYPLILAACAGALSSCAEGGLTAGPFNRLWTCSTTDGSVVSLVDQSSELYFDIDWSGETMVAVATSANSRETSVIQLNPQLEKTLLAQLPGRRMVGPVPGPDGLWLVATCHGLRCGEPWALHAILSQRESP